MPEFTHSLTVEAPPGPVLDAFFDAEALATWWHVRRSLCVPRPLGLYAVEWDPTEWKDDVLGHLGGTLHGTVVEFVPGREFFVANAYWLPPEGEALGPMALDVTCSQHGNATVLRVRQSGGEKSARWSRYFDLVSTGFAPALDGLKSYLESRWKD